jgi:putative proteasome-type protease
MPFFSTSHHKSAVDALTAVDIHSTFCTKVNTNEVTVTYCLGITTNEGLVLASDSRTNAGFDQVNTCRKMFQFVQPGERVFVIMTSGSLSISQSVISLLRDDFESGQGLARAKSLYDAARIVGDCVRRISDIDRASLERDSYNFNVHLLIGGQVRGDSLYLQLGECKYGRPILDRGIQASTSLEVAAKYALLSMDATMRSNVTVGPPFDLLLYKKDSLMIDRYRRVCAGDADLNSIHASWEQSLRRAVEQLPDIEFEPAPQPCAPGAAAKTLSVPRDPQPAVAPASQMQKGPTSIAASGDTRRQPE